MQEEKKRANSLRQARLKVQYLFLSVEAINQEVISNAFLFLKPIVNQ